VNRLLAVAAAMLAAAPTSAHAVHHHARTLHHAKTRYAHRSNGHGMSVNGRKELIWENAQATRLHYVRFTKMLLGSNARMALVPLPANDWISIDPKLLPEYRWCLPQARSGLMLLGRRYYRKFHKPMRLNSAVRTVEYQRTLQHDNPNAIAATGDMGSLHLTGMAIDIKRKGLPSDQSNWLQNELASLSQECILHYNVEKLKQNVFHVVFLNPPDGPHRVSCVPPKKSLS
jgi:hypothetical protein